MVTAFHSDDYPYARVEANFADGSVLMFCSDSQNLLMLPWRDGGGRKSFSSDLSRALAAVLPSISSNRRRLAEVPSQEEFDNYLGQGIESDYSKFQVQIAAPAVYAALQSRFAIRDITSIDAQSHDFVVTVGLPTGPSNLTLRTKLAVAGKVLAKPSDLDEMADELSTAVAAPGLRQAMQANPHDDFRMERSIGWQLFDARTKKQFVMQMLQLHKLPELAEHPALLDGAVMVEQGRDPTYWVALHDRRAIEWKRFVMGHIPAGHHECASVPMSTSDEDFPDNENLDDCLGQVYDANGIVL
jgi:hypothetical protein